MTKNYFPQDLLSYKYKGTLIISNNGNHGKDINGYVTTKTSNTLEKK